MEEGIAWIPAVLHGFSTAGAGSSGGKGHDRGLRESLSLQGVFKCRDRQIEKNPTLCWSDALE